MDKSSTENLEKIGDGASSRGSTSPIPQETKDVKPARTYDELFPALPGALPTAARDSPPLTNWSTNSDMRIASSVITQVFRIPREERSRQEANSKFGESVASSMCSDITSKTGAHIEISVAKDQSLTFVVTGKNDEVVKAKKLTLERFQTPARQIVKIPKDHHRFILGKQYKRLKELEAATGTKIQVPAANVDSEEIIVIGPREATEKAVHEIQVTSDERTRQTLEKMDVPKIYHPFISCNDEIAAIVAQGTMRLNMPPASVETSELSIIGEKDVVLRAKELILGLASDLAKTCTTVSVEIPRSQHRFITGSRRQGVMEIMKETGVSVEVPNSDASVETVTLRGPGHKLGKALSRVYNKANSVKQENITTAPFLHKFIIGRKGANIKQLTQDFPKVHIEFTDDNGIITLEGPPEDVDKASATLQTTIKGLEQTLTQDVMEVDPQYYKFIIGKGGANINRIRQETAIVISISETSGRNVITLQGSKAGVATAKQELTELITKMENEKESAVHIDQRFHRQLIGQKGENIREVRDKFNQVQISFPDPGEKSDIVRVKGTNEDVEGCARHLVCLVTKMKEESFQLKVTIHRQHHKFIIGKSGSTINKIREETNARIELPTESQNSDEITITGRKKDCELAKEKILKIKNELASTVELDVMIPCKFHNLLIGAGGKLIQNISEECGGVSIKFPSPESKSDKVTIRGHKEEVQKAKKILVDMSNEREISGFTAEVKANPQLHRFLIGRNGVNVKKIREKTGARISFPSEQDTDNHVITIMGKKESVKEAKEELERIIKSLDNVMETTTKVDPKHHRYFVSRRGEVLRQISDQFGGVTISFPRQGVDSDQVTVKGAKDCVEDAVKRIQEIAKDLDELVTIEVEIPQKHHRALMGTRGTRVQGISVDCDVQIKFPGRDMPVDDTLELVNGDVRPQDKVVIQGKREKCQKAKEALLAAIPVTEDVEVPFKHHRYLIGVKGEAVKQLITEFDVQIKVPPVQDQKDAITIQGPKANVERAKQAILAKVDEFKAGEEDRLAKSFQIQLRVAPEYLPKIIGRKGTVISKIREKHDVNIQFPPRGSEDEDMITIVGYEKNCAEARDSILEITGDLDTMVKETVLIDSRLHSRLIGTRGRSIRKVMDDYKVDIKFPRGEESPDEVVIRGQQANVDECREHLLELVEEFMDDIDEKADLNRYISGPASNGYEPEDGPRRKPGPGEKEFVVTGAPWTQAAPQLDSSEDFPSMGASSSPSMTPTWGPRRA